MTRKTKVWLYSVSAVLCVAAGTYGWIGQTGVLVAVREGSGWMLVYTMEGLMNLVDLLITVYRWTWK